MGVPFGVATVRPLASALQVELVERFGSGVGELLALEKAPVVAQGRQLALDRLRCETSCDLGVHPGLGISLPESFNGQAGIGCGEAPNIRDIHTHLPVLEWEQALPFASMLQE